MNLPATLEERDHVNDFLLVLYRITLFVPFYRTQTIMLKSSHLKKSRCLTIEHRPQVKSIIPLTTILTSSKTLIVKT